MKHKSMVLLSKLALNCPSRGLLDHEQRKKLDQFGQMSRSSLILTALCTMNSCHKVKKSTKTSTYKPRKAFVEALNLRQVSSMWTQQKVLLEVPRGKIRRTRRMLAKNSRTDRAFWAKAQILFLRFNQFFRIFLLYFCLTV